MSRLFRYTIIRILGGFELTNFHARRIIAFAISSSIQVARNRVYFVVFEKNRVRGRENF